MSDFDAPSWALIAAGIAALIMTVTCAVQVAWLVAKRAQGARLRRIERRLDDYGTFLALLAEPGPQSSSPRLRVLPGGRRG